MAAAGLVSAYVLVDDAAVAEEARRRDLELVAERARDRVPGEGGRAGERGRARLVGAQQEAVEARRRGAGGMRGRGEGERAEAREEEAGSSAHPVRLNRHRSVPCRPSNEGCLARQRARSSRRAGGEDERVVAPDELDRGREAALGRAARQRERRQAGGVERVRVLDQPLAHLEVAGAARADARCHDRERRRQEQVDVGEDRIEALAVALALAVGGRGGRVGDREAALELDTDVLAVELLLLGEQLPVHVRDLVAERVVRLLGAGQLERPASGEAGCGVSDAGTHERVGRVEPGDADTHLLERLQLPRLPAGHERREHRLAAGHVARQRPGVVEATARAGSTRPAARARTTA